jgi:hypothetical protein
MIQIKHQPAELQSLIKVAIQKVMSDVIHTTAYRPVDKLTAYYCLTLYASAKQLNLRGYMR